MKRLQKLSLALTFLLAGLGAQANAAQEQEPNNFDQEANVVSDTVIRAQANDGSDWFKVSLPSSGPVTVRLTGLPAEADVQLGVKGFPHVGWQDGKGELSYSFDAANSEGLIWVMVRFAETVCGSDWCAGRFSQGGPWYGTKTSKSMPSVHEGTPILAEIPSYTLTIDTAGMNTNGSLPAANDSAAPQVEWQDEADEKPAPPGSIIWEDEEDIGG